MAVILTVLSMIMACGEDLCEKKSVSARIEEALKTLVWYGIADAVVLCALLIFFYDETLLMPHELILRTPVAVLTPVCSILCLFFALMAYKYIGISERNTFVNVDGMFYIVLLVIYYLRTGNAQFATRLFTPYTIIGLILIIGATFIYPYTKDERKEQLAAHVTESGSSTKLIIMIGIVLAVISAMFDGTESFISSVIIGDEVLDSIDFLIAAAFVQLIITVIIWVGLWVKNKKIYNPFRKTEKYRMISQTFAIVADVLYVFALSDDALLGVILWNAFPILDILGARFLMKEKLVAKQYLILAMLIVGAVLVGISNNK